MYKRTTFNAYYQESKVRYLIEKLGINISEFVGAAIDAFLVSEDIERRVEIFKSNVLQSKPIYKTNERNKEILSHFQQMQKEDPLNSTQRTIEKFGITKTKLNNLRSRYKEQYGFIDLRHVNSGSNKKHDINDLIKAYNELRSSETLKERQIYTIMEKKYGISLSTFNRMKREAKEAKNNK